MYYSISGNLLYKDENFAVIDNNGIAFEIVIGSSTSEKLPEAGMKAVLFTKMIVRENDIFLVGFPASEDRRLFESLMTVSGIGPKQALRLLSDLSAAEIRNAVISGNETLLSRVKGIGAKTASRIILELKDKMKKLPIADMPMHEGVLEKKKMETLMAMRVLGYTDSESKRVIDSVFSNKSDIEDKEVEDIIKIVLSGMAR